MIKKGLAKLDERQLRQLLKQLGTIYRMSTREISQMVGLSKSRVHQIVSKK